MSSAVFWPYLIGTVKARFWVVCKTTGDKTAAVVDPYDSVIQESYVEGPEQHEGRLCLFTTSAGARRHMRTMLLTGQYQESDLKVCRIPIENLAEIISQIDKAYAIVRHRNLRVDVYDLQKDGKFTRELLYSRWVPKH